MSRAFLLVFLCGFLALGTELVVAVSTEPPSLDPTTNAAAIIRLLLQYNLYETLVGVNEAGALQPLLAKSWEISEDSRVYTFHLHEDVVFHDGTPCDAEAVRKSFLRAKDPYRGHVHPEYFQTIKRIEVVNPQTIRFFLEEPDASFLTLLALGDSVIVPDRDDLRANPVGTGPFRYDRWDPGYQLRLVRHERYWDHAKPKLDALVFRFISDSTSQLAALQAGDVDVVVEVTPEVAQALGQSKDVRILSAPQDLVQIIAINKTRPPFDDLRVRQALASAVDRDELIRLVALGYASPVGSHLAPTAPYYADMTWVYPYDPARARELLAAAGYAQGFTATLTLPANYAFHVRTGEVLVAQLAHVGIALQLVLVDWPTWLERVYNQGDFELTVIGHVGRLDPALTLAFYGPTRPDYYFRRGWENPELNEILRAGAAFADPKVRQSIYTVAQYLIAKEVVNVFLQAPHRILAYRANVGGLRLSPLYVLPLAEAEKG
ncbi:MAG: ABC transporter substrate-binding protein [Candidatus Bipolaricaulota bacterium]|nr:ABC transporter substrate-binding protein [Candidatus Bipolaricaulota bacterium]MDW8127245.1 ABC transporter substrate-binding protein [Candidatus Bipolaricaulota bacterium]